MGPGGAFSGCLEKACGPGEHVEAEFGVEAQRRMLCERPMDHSTMPGGAPSTLNLIHSSSPSQWCGGSLLCEHSAIR